VTTFRRPTILVVEDEPVVRNLIVDVLTRHGWLVFEADTAVEAQTVCSALKDEPLDLLIVADELSPVPGRELADRIRANCPNAKILHLSGDVAPAATGGSLQKPFTAGQLVSAVNSLMHPRMQ
jgi:two-component system, cell cycle sensor histidine kinase and response regulator CckA